MGYYYIGIILVYSVSPLKLPSCNYSSRCNTDNLFTPSNRPWNSLYCLIDLDNSFQETFNQGLYTEKYLYVDDDIIVVDKPANIQTAPGFISKDCLANRVACHFGINRTDHMIVHRLDYSTSGVLLFARNHDSLRDLHRQFKYRRIFKSYRAVVSGHLPTFEGSIDLPVGRDAQRGPPFCTVNPLSKDSRASWTDWHVLKYGARNTLVQLRPITGRTHQLRIHLAAIGHPILGDCFYSQPIISSGADRLLLHADELRIMHPRTNVAIKFTAKCPFNVEDYD